VLERRKAAHHDNPCFEMFLWYPLPNGEWDILFGTGDPAEWHYHLWEDRGLKYLAEAWGLERKDLWAGAGDGAIPTGYVDFETVGVRDVPVLILPDPMPEGWSSGKVKQQLECGQEIKKTVYVERRAAKPEAVKKLIGILKDLQVYRSVPSEPSID